ncbi:hypothetical protein M427DRAFT_53761 [Gonapodya prolifera JEL478]|uniref:Uncharacterized protein n=1 Tax=Gonapodya prolifera (strain JEL478) TaxID=1344416 RepID=A0A139ANP2_GONPJ|nr:hypothetical protein M427DRAFT_53761 [Gonapodya prolifera JEL478]|eukprot:KXS18369.1 hypothetical protein M427DRAFT_53761 [Gonapodya prolifera JEL478]
MNTSLVNDALLEAAERGDAAGVAKALSRSAHPRTRKRVVLTCDVYEDSRYSKPLFGGEEKEKGTGRCETKHLRCYGESALALAIIANSVESARALLEAGADPNEAIQWTVVRGHDIWVLDQWDKLGAETWDFTYIYDTALHLAIGRGQTRDHDGSRASTVEYLASKGQLWINSQGGLVKLRNPRPHESFVTKECKVNFEMVNLLCQHGARISDQGAEETISTMMRGKSSIASTRPRAKVRWES